MDKSLMLSQIKKHLKIDSDTNFAEFLGIKPNVLANWRTRNTFSVDLLFTKCDELNLQWLVTGRGEMLRNSVIDKLSVLPLNELQLKYIALTEKIENLERIIHMKDQLIDSKDQTISILLDKINDAGLNIANDTPSDQYKKPGRSQVNGFRSIYRSYIQSMVNRAIENRDLQNVKYSGI